MPYEITELQKQQVSEIGIDGASFYRKSTKEDSAHRKQIVFGISDAGASNYLLAALPKLNQNNDVNYFIAANNIGKELLEKRHQDLGLEREYLPLANLKPSLWVAGHSVSGSFEQLLAYFGRARQIPSVWFEDMPPFLGFYKRHLAAQGKLIIPDHVFVASERAAQQEIGLVPDFEGRTEVIGNPDFDKFANEDVKGTRERVRQELGIDDNENLLVYMATKTMSAVAAAKGLAEAIRGIELDNYRIAFRIHPQEMKDPAMASEYLAIAQVLGEHVVDTQKFNTNEIGMAAGLIITDTSTEGHAAVLRRIPTLTILIPHFMRLRDEWREELPPTPAIALDGSSAVAVTEDDIAPALRSVLFDNEFIVRLHSRMDGWSVDGKATERFVNRITELAGTI